MKDLPSAIQPMWERLLQLRSRDELLPLVYSQLSSDFSRAGMILPFGSTLRPGEWSDCLAAFLGTQPQPSVAHLIYLIDLPEKLVTAIHASDMYFHQLADAMIYRELVKVYYKISYSS